MFDARCDGPVVGAHRERPAGARVDRTRARSHLRRTPRTRTASSSRSTAAATPTAAAAESTRSASPLAARPAARSRGQHRQRADVHADAEPLWRTAHADRRRVGLDRVRRSDTVKNGVRQFIESLAGTPVQIQIVRFDTTASVLGDPTAWTKYFDMTEPGRRHGPAGGGAAARRRRRRRSAPAVARTGRTRGSARSTRDDGTPPPRSPRRRSSSSPTASPR